MNCAHLTDTLGFACTLLDEAGQLAHVATPFRFADGDPLPVYLELADGQARFFDDGGVFLHFKGRGLTLDGRSQARFITKAAERHGASYSADWILQASAPAAQLQDAFSRYMGALHALCAWELDNEGIAQDPALLVEEAVLAILARQPQARIEREPVVTGVSGKTRAFSLAVDGKIIAVTSAHHAAVASALLNMVDARQAADNQGREFMFLLDDRLHPERAHADATILQAAAPVQLLSNLQAAAPDAALH